MSDKVEDALARIREDFPMSPVVANRCADTLRDEIASLRQKLVSAECINEDIAAANERLKQQLAAAQRDKELAVAMALREYRASVELIYGKGSVQVVEHGMTLSPAATLAKLAELERDAESYRWIEENGLLALNEILSLYSSGTIGDAIHQHAARAK